MSARTPPPPFPEGWLLDYMEGTLEAEHRPEVEAFLAAHPAWAEELTALEDLAQTLQALPMVGAPPGFLEGVRARVLVEPAPGGIFARLRAFFSPRRMGFSGAVGALAVMAAVFIVVRHPEGERMMQEAAPAASRPMEKLAPPTSDLQGIAVQEQGAPGAATFGAPADDGLEADRDSEARAVPEASLYEEARGPAAKRPGAPEVAAEAGVKKDARGRADAPTSEDLAAAPSKAKGAVDAPLPEPSRSQPPQREGMKMPIGGDPAPAPPPRGYALAPMEKEVGAADAFEDSDEGAGLGAETEAPRVGSRPEAEPQGQALETTSEGVLDDEAVGETLRSSPVGRQEAVVETRQAEAKRDRRVNRREEEAVKGEEASGAAAPKPAAAEAPRADGAFAPAPQTYGAGGGGAAGASAVLDLGPAGKGEGDGESQARATTTDAPKAAAVEAEKLSQDKVTGGLITALPYADVPYLHLRLKAPLDDGALRAAIRQAGAVPLEGPSPAGRGAVSYLIVLDLELYPGVLASLKTFGTVMGSDLTDREQAPGSFGLILYP